MNKIYIKNERFMEFIDELATEMTELFYGVDTWEVKNMRIRFKDKAQDYYNEKYDEIESKANKIILLYSDNELN